MQFLLKLILLKIFNFYDDYYFVNIKIYKWYGIYM